MNAPIVAVASPAAVSAAGPAAGHASAEPRTDALLAALFDAALGAALDAAVGEVPMIARTDRAADADVARAAPAESESDRRPDEAIGQPSVPSDPTARDALIALAGLAMPSVAMATTAEPRVPAAADTADFAAHDLRTPGAPDRVPGVRAPTADTAQAITRPASPEAALPSSAPAFPMVAPRDTPSPVAGPERESPPGPPAAAGPPPIVNPPAPPAVTIAPPIDSAAFVPALADEVVHLLQIRADRVELQVRPIELGPIDLAIRFDGREAHLVVHAVHADARTALENSLPGLRALLADAGIALGGASIHDGRASEGGERAFRGDVPPQRRADAPAPAPAVVWTRRAGSGVIDTYA